jgi:hypothetical protein
MQKNRLGLPSCVHFTIFVQLKYLHQNVKVIPKASLVVVMKDGTSQNTYKGQGQPRPQAIHWTDHVSRVVWIFLKKFLPLFYNFILLQVWNLLGWNFKKG